MDLIEINRQLDQIVEQTDRIYREYHVAKTEFDNLDEQKKPILASYELEYTKKQPDASQAEIARHALANEGFKSYLEGLNEARGRYLRALALTKTQEIKLSCLQSLSKNYLKELN